jgi:paraquat-inducible protein B
VWAFPIVAAIIGIWLAYTTLAQKGPSISITFRTASGIEPGKTLIKHHDVVLGVVDKVAPSDDLSHVIVTAKMTKTAGPHLRKGTRFWVVQPRIGLTGLSGLETLVSGAYIEVDPGRGAAERSFAGLLEPPVVRADVPGREFLLKTTQIGSIGPGSPVFFHGIKVGEATRYNFEGVGGDIIIHVFVREPYDKLVYDGTRFWNASGINLSAGANGFKVELESLQAVLAGGIAFETADSARVGAPSKEGTTFPLFTDHSAAAEAGFTARARAVAEFEGSVRGIEVGSPVEFRGIKIGRVLDYRLVIDPAAKTAKVPVQLEIDIERIAVIGHPLDRQEQMSLMDRLVELGLRAQLRSASLLTGQLVIALDFFPDAPPATIDRSGTVPKIPTIPTDLETVTRSVTQILDRLAALPLEDTVGDVRALLASLRGAGDSADATMKRVDSALASLNASYGRDSQVRSETVDLLRQLQETAKSVRLLANFLEQHPEALMRGKAGSGR